MKISIIVPAFNEEKLLGGTLRSLREAASAFDERGWRHEIIVCDNNSSDRTAEVAREGGAVVVFEPVNQIGRARNRGAAASSGEWLIFVDADSHPSPALFEEVAALMEGGRVLAGGCTVEMDEQTLKQAARRVEILGRLMTAYWNLISRVCRYAAGSFIFCEAAAFRAVGGFSLDLYAAEEVNLSRKLKKLARSRGKRMVILHRHPLVTSARKLKLYSPWEYLCFFSRVILTMGGSLKKSESCQPWYDGRR